MRRCFWAIFFFFGNHCSVVLCQFFVWIQGQFLHRAHLLREWACTWLEGMKAVAFYWKLLLHMVIFVPLLITPKSLKDIVHEECFLCPFNLTSYAKNRERKCLLFGPFAIILTHWKIHPRWRVESTLGLVTDYNLVCNNLHVEVYWLLIFMMYKDHAGFRHAHTCSSAKIESWVLPRDCLSQTHTETVLLSGSGFSPLNEEFT